MKKKGKIIVLSLGGSIIIPDSVDVKILKDFKKVVEKHLDEYKFIIVTGGGSIARKYINALEESGIKEHKLQSFAGISATRMNARFMSYFFGMNPENGIPHTIKEVENYLKKQDIVFCGGLEYHPNQTSDATASQLAAHFKTEFVNLTNVPGLYDKNPLENKDAQPILKITWRQFRVMASRTAFKPGQHFVLDQSAAEIIEKNKITTYIVGKDMKQLDKLLDKKSFQGSIISGEED